MPVPALAAVASPTGPVAVDQVFDVPVDLIEFGELLRPVDTVWAEALGGIMEAEGQRQPIEVCRLPGRTTFRLSFGAHRLTAAQLRGWATIRAFVVTADAGQRLRAQISENLWRKGLSPLERATFVARLHEQLRLEAGITADTSLQQMAANRRWKVEAEDASRTMRQAFGWAQEVGQQLGLDRATVYRDLQLYRGLLPSVVAQLAETPVAKNAAQLRALAKLPEADQRAAAKLIVEGRAKSAAEAIGILQNKAKPSADNKRLSAFIGAYQRMGTAERRAALETFRATFPGALDG